jgi:hypothetical protein
VLTNSAERFNLQTNIKLLSMKNILFIGFFLFLGFFNQSFGQTVYASAKGEKYHTADCKLSGDADETTLAAAKKAGKSACGVCKPNEHAKDKLTNCTGKTSDGSRCKRMTANKSGKCYQHTGK